MKLNKLLLTGALAIILTGCAALAPTANPLVVRAQQTQAIGYTTIKSFVTLEHNNEAFVKANIPAMHTYAEWLRAPQVINATNVYPRGIAFFKSLDAIVVQYKKGTADSNQVVNVLATVETAVNQAQWYISSMGASTLTNQANQLEK